MAPRKKDEGAEPPVPGNEAVASASNAPVGLAVIPEDRWLSKDRSKEYFEINFTLSPEGDLGAETGPLTLPTMSLLNAMSKVLNNPPVDGLKQGVFYNNRTMEIFDEGFEAVILMKYDERYMSSAPGNISDIVCSSKDGKGLYGLSLGEYDKYSIPTIKVDDPVSHFPMTVGNCALCPNKEFTTGPDGKRVKPRCRQVVWLVCCHPNILNDSTEYIQAIIDGDEDVMSEMFRSVFAIPMASTMLGKGGPFELIANTARMDRAYFARKFSFKPTQITRGQFQWYSMSVRPLAPLNDTQKIIARSLSHLMQKVRPVLENPLEMLDDNDRNVGTPGSTAGAAPPQKVSEVTIE